MDIRVFQSISDMNKQEHQKKKDAVIDSSIWANELGKASFAQWFNHPLLSYKNLFLQVNQDSEIKSKFNVEVSRSTFENDQEVFQFGIHPSSASIKSVEQYETVALRKIDTEANIERINCHHLTEGKTSVAERSSSTKMNLENEADDRKFQNAKTEQVPCLSLMNNKISVGYPFFGQVENVSMFEKNVSNLPVANYLAQESNALVLTNQQLATSPSITLRPIVFEVPVIDVGLLEVGNSQITADQNNSSTLISRVSSESTTVYFPLRQTGRSDSRRPVRIHVENSADGINVWIGCEQNDDKLMSAVIKHIETWLHENGLIASTIFANGQPVLDRSNTKATRLTSDIYRRPDKQSFDEFTQNDLLVNEAFDKYEQNRKGK